MPSISELVLHVGMHKTGSTSIQSSLYGFDNGLIRVARLGHRNHSVSMYTMFATDPYNYQQHKQFSRTPAQINRLREKYLSALDRELSLQRQTLIISGEDISLLDRDGVKAMHAYFKTKVGRIRVVAYVREPLGFASSAFQQYVRGGIRHALIPTPNYRQRFESLIDFFGKPNVTFEHFHRDTLTNGSVVADFCEKAGIDYQSITEMEKNESVSFEATQLTLHFNQYGMPSTGSPKLQRTRDAFLLKLAAAFPDNKNNSLPASEVWTASDMVDIQWMEQVSTLRLSDESANIIMHGPVGEASDALKTALDNISVSTLRVLQAHVKLIDEDVGKSANITTLLNVLFMSLYFKHGHRPLLDLAIPASSAVLRVGKLLQIPFRFIRRMGVRL